MKIGFRKDADAYTISLIHEIVDGKVVLSDLSEDEFYQVNHAVLFDRTIPNRVKATSDRLFRLALRYKQKGLRVICSNTKTGDSVDFRNFCTIGKCKYCYVQNPIVQTQMSACWETSLDNRQVALFREYLKVRKTIVPNYFLRFFSFADCDNKDLSDLDVLLGICQDEGVKAVVISKNYNTFEVSTKYYPDCVSYYSLDSGKYNAPSSVSKFGKLVAKYGKGVRAFYLVCNYGEFKDCISSMPTDTVVVPYHGHLSTVNITELLKPKALKLFYPKVCCTSNRCLGCMTCIKGVMK